MRAVLIAVATLVWAAAAWAQGAGDKPPGWLGVEVRTVDEALVAERGLALDFGAYVVTVAPDSPAKAEIAVGDVITSVNGKTVHDRAEFAAALSALKAGDTVQLGRTRPGAAARKVAVALVAEPKALPAALRLMLDTGGHTASIKGLAWTPDGREIVSAGNDKVIRVWDAATGRTLRTIRGAVGDGDDGQNFALALSPDGKWLAVGGFMATFNGSNQIEVGAIRLYDFATGTLVRFLKGHRNVVNGLAFSPDGRRLISGAGDNSAILWDVPTGALQHRLEGHTDDIYAVGFTPDGARVVTGSYDTVLKLWDASTGTLIATMPGHAGKVQTLAVNPRDGAIASGDRSGEIRLWDGRTGAPLRVLAKVDEGIGALAFSPDGMRLVSSCGNGPPCATKPVRVWDVASGRQVASYPDHDNIVLAAAFSPDGRRVATGGGQHEEIHIWDPATGQRRTGPDGQPLALAGSGAPVWAVGVSADGTRIGWGSIGHGGGNQLSALEHQLRLPATGVTLVKPEPIASAATDWRRAVARQDGLSLVHRKGGGYGYDAILEVKRGDAVLARLERGATDGYGHSAYTLTPDGRTLISGGSGVIEAYDVAAVLVAAAGVPDHTLKGAAFDKLARPFVGHQGDIWALATSPDGRLLVSGSDDQTIRLWNLATAEPIVTLFRGSNGEWVLWTEQGYYTGSDGAGRLITWQINHGPEREADEVTGEQIADQFRRPDIVARAIQLASATAAVKEASATQYTLADLLNRGPPKVVIEAVAGAPPKSSVSVGTDTVTVKFRIQSSAERLWQSFQIKNGDRLLATRNRDEMKAPDGLITQDVRLAHGENHIHIIAATQDRITSNPSEGQATVTATGRGALDQLGTLHVVAIGVDRFPDLNICGKSGTLSCNLRFASADASEFVRVITARLGPQHQSKEVYLLSQGAGATGVPTESNIRTTLQHVRNVARDADTVVIFAASHGVNVGLDYFLLGSTAAPEGTGYRGGVPWSDFKLAIEGTHGRRLLFLDTCHSGGAYNGYNDKVTAAAFKADIVAYTATDANQEAPESATVGHGLFTYAIAQGLDGGAVPPGQAVVRVDDLGAYLKTTLPKLSNLTEHHTAPPVPAFVRGPDADNYVLAQW